MKSLSLVLAIIFFIQSMPLALASSNVKETDDILIKLQNLTQNFESNCISSKVHNIEGHLLAYGMSESCWLLITEINHLESKLAGLHPELKNTINCSNGNCVKDNPIVNLPTLPLDSLSCTPAEKERVSNNCAGDLSCFLVSTVTTLPIINHSLISPEKILPKGLNPKSCSPNDSCATQIVTAFYDSILNFFNSSWDLLKKAGGFAKSKVVDFWNLVSDAEDSSSASQLALAKASEDEGLFQMLKNDFGGTIAKIWQGLITSVKEWLKNDIFCEKWEGTPHRGKCIAPAQGFDCISCKSMVNGVCAISGVFISEILPAFITGGLTTAAKHGAAAATRLYKATFKVSDKTIKTIKNSRTIKASLGLANHVDKVTKVGSVLSKINRYFISPARKVAKVSFNVAAAIVRNSKSYIAETAKGKYIVFAQDGLKLAGKVALYPIENNMTILAFKAGQRSFDKAFKLALPSIANKTSVGLAVTSHAPQLDSVLTKIEIGHLRNKSTLSLELEQVKLLDGKRKVLTQKALGTNNPKFSEIIRTIYPELTYGELAKNVSKASILAREKELYLHISKIRNPELKKSMLHKYEGLIVQSKQRKALLKNQPSYKEIVDNSNLSPLTKGARGVKLVGKLSAKADIRIKLEAGIRNASITSWDKKKDILVSAGFTKDEAQKIIDYGFVGVPPN
ncbi:MAG TPA: hypothetical protein VKZ84_06970 [Bacteriovoracaceae bacterium]|nr:hypothetical protein [Bacteriovoracaceae bacterium]